MSATVVWNPQAPALVLAKVELLLAKIAHDIEAWAKLHAPVDTGFLRGSIRAMPDGAGGGWTVRVGAEYGAYVELGTVNMAAQPYLLPAVETVRGMLGAGSPVTILGPASP